MTSSIPRSDICEDRCAVGETFAEGDEAARPRKDRSIAVSSAVDLRVRQFERRATMDETTQKRSATTLPIAQIIAIAMLGWALIPSNPYGYYILLRVVVCGICAYLAFRAYELHLNGWIWALGITAIVYNPLIRIYLNRQIWSVVNLGTIVLLGVTIWAFQRAQKKPV